MRHRHLSALGTLALALPCIAFADESSRWLASGGIGLSRVDGHVPITSGASVDEEDVGWRAFAARKFGRHFAVGGGYLDLGAIEESGQLGTPALPFTDEIAVDGFEIAAFGLWPIGPRIELYGTASFLRWEQDVTTTFGIQQFAASESGTSPGLGGGLNFWWRDSWALTFDARRYLEVGDDATGREHRRDLFTAGVTFRFGD